MDKTYKDLDIDENLYNEKTLFLLNIRELRDIGRKFGVPSPTTMKKQELVDYILKIVYGEVQTETRSACGRPNVREFDINHYIEKIKRKTELTPELIKVKLDDVDSIFKVADEGEKVLTKEVVQRIFVEDENKFFLRERGFVASQTDIEVPELIVKKLKLENFDVVEVIISDDAFKIISINGEKATDYESEINKVGKAGQKQVFHLRTKEEIEEEIKNLEKICESNGVELLVFSNKEYKGSHTQSVVIEEGERAAKIYKKFIGFVEACEKCIFENQNIVVAIDELDRVMESIESFDEESSSRIKKHLQQKVEKLLSLGNALNIYKLESEKQY